MSMSDERVSVSAFVDARDRDRLRELARSHERSLSGEVRVAIHRHLRDQTTQPAAHVASVVRHTED